MKNKLIVIVSLIVLLLPLNIKALTGGVNLNCDSNVVTVNTLTKCTLSGNSSEEISAISAKLSTSGNINITNISTSTIWQGNGEGGSIDLYTDNNKSGSFAIATFTIQASAIAGSGTINISNISFSDSLFNEHFISDKALTITVKEVEKPKEENNIQNNKPANNNQKPTISQNNNQQIKEEDKKSSDATLKSLTLDQITINFSKEITEYNVEVANNIKSITINAQATNSNAKVSIPKNLNLHLGRNDFEIKVVAEDGTEKIYKLHINRLEKVLSANSKLKSLEIEGYKLSFEGNNYIYDLTNINTSSLKIKAVTEDENAKIEIYGNNSIGKKDSVVIKVIAEDGTTSEYIIYANNTKSSNINISFILILMLFIFSLGVNIFFINKKLIKSKK